MKRYTQNNDFFEKIDNERNAYWLGFLYADGCIRDHSETKNYMHIELHIQDKYILDQFIRDLDSNRRVKVTSRGYARLDVCNNKIGSDLIKLGCVPRKSNILKFPTEDIVPKELLHHFLRGYMDGDGCISTYLKKKRQIYLLICEVKFVGTYDMLEGIKSFFESDKKILGHKHCSTCFQMSFTGRKYRKYVDKLYENATIYLTRKKEKWDKFICDIEAKKKNSRVLVKANNNYEELEVKPMELEKVITVYKEVKVDKFKYINLKETHKKMYDMSKYIENKNKVDNRVIQYNLNGEKIKVWDDYNDIAKYYNINARSIRRACNGEIKTYFKFKWEYCTKRYGSSNKYIYQYDLENNIVKKWSSIKDAALSLNITPQSIQRCATNKVKSCSGYIWRYDSL
ncbi:NUMOD1 domain-containing DNA-binding protein [uncultured Clostridium sp.]|uniref:NUMOD1 domain-containing DNA-binding protein n=1 Tax=uncultured Clostridium sp. TaxID=59620 RepID=UPI00260C75B9|nr:NUMOD1 domain-containing DNA-binding protein [uncultured Clostridium sp.]